MDPNTTYLEILRGLMNRDWEEVKKHNENLYQWLNKGGFPPDGFTVHTAKAFVGAIWVLF
jgi:hypothetical protein